MISGALVIDKPAGMTSAEVVRQIKREFRPEKIGHGGTLDPAATGMLVLLLGKATKLQSFIMDGWKTYEGSIRLGQRTDTDDLEGTQVETDTSYCLSDSELRLRLPELREAFTGRVMQRPPAFSALKVSGERSYDLARRGELVQHALREINISDLKLEVQSVHQLRYQVRCSKGTYIRSLARDIGAALGTYGCLESIRRTASGSFVYADMHSLSRVLEGPLEDFLRAPNEILRGLPQVLISAVHETRLRQGDQRVLSDLALPHVASERGVLVDADGKFVGMLEFCAEQAMPGWRIGFLA